MLDPEATNSAAVDPAKRVELARTLFVGGCNCAQSVSAAFAELIGMPEERVKRLTVGFGAGVGRMREVCGAVTGMAFVISALYDDERGVIYERVQDVAARFREGASSIICRELLGLETSGVDSPVPEERTREYYETRPCPALVGSAAEILARYVSRNPPTASGR